MRFKSKQLCEEFIKRHGYKDAIAMAQFSEYPQEDGSYEVLYWYIYYV